MYENLGSFAPVWGEWMKRSDPKAFQRLKARGKDRAAAEAFEERAEPAFQRTLSELERLNPQLPRGTLEAMARELILADLLPTPSDSPEEDEADMTEEVAGDILRGYFRTLGPGDRSPPERQLLP